MPILESKKTFDSLLWWPEKEILTSKQGGNKVIALQIIVLHRVTFIRMFTEA